MNIIWLVLFFVSLITAWYVGRLSHKNYSLPQKVNLPRDYLVGLNFLLNEEPDKAVDVFIKMLEVDSNTVETHLAVGKLFRKRGEVDRAIRIHQNLIARPQLEKMYREQSLFELGQDYLSAGVLDRAERIFLELAEIKTISVAALRALVDIYQQEKAWENAIPIVKKLEAATKDNMRPVIAHYYCELADIAFLKGCLAETNDYIKKALDVDQHCVRASLLQAHFEVHKKDYIAALRSVKRIKSQNPIYLSEAIDLLAECYDALPQKERFVNFLLEVMGEYPHAPVTQVLSKSIHKWQSDEIATDFVANYVRKYPSLNGAHLFIDLYLSKTEGRARDDLLILHGLTKKLLANKPDYKCASCGFAGKSLYWLCPGCKKWSSVKPLHCLE